MRAVSAPRRHVPWAVRTRVVFGGATAVFSGALIFLVLTGALVDRGSPLARGFSALLVLAFGAGSIANVRRRRSSVRLLARGRVGYATLAEKTETRVGRGARMYLLRFTFDDGGVTRTIELRTQRPQPVTDDRSEQIVYLPEAPDKAELVDALPGQPRISIDDTIGADGQLVPALAALGWFGTAVLVFAIGVCLWLR